MIAPAKLNLCLYVGEAGAGGLHEICSLLAPISLSDRIVVRDAADDEVVCPGVPAPDLTAMALRALREAGWRRGPLRIEVEKRIPVAAGLGGGSADAAAVLRLAREDFEAVVLATLAATLGADVPSQLDPRFSLVGGSGERVVPLPEPRAFGAVLLPDPDGLSTADVYAETDRLGPARSGPELERLRSELLTAAATAAGPLGYRDLLVNDLAPAAISLRPSIGEALHALEAAGADLAIVTGSGPTAVGLFADLEAAGRAAAELAAGGREAIVVRSGIGED